MDVARSGHAVHEDALVTHTRIRAPDFEMKKERITQEYARIPTEYVRAHEEAGTMRENMRGFRTCAISAFPILRTSLII